MKIVNITDLLSKHDKVTGGYTVEHMCNDAYKQGMRDASSKLERITRIIEE